MRACAAIFLFAAWPCLIHTQKSRTNRESTSAGNKDEYLLRHLGTCFKYLGPSKCISAYGIWLTERPSHENEYSLHHESFPWRRYDNVSSDEIYDKLCGETERLLKYRSLELQLTQDYSLQMGVTGNGSLNVDILRNDERQESGRSSVKKLQKQFYKIMPLLLVPGLIMSAILPFFLPSLKMLTLAAGMLNNMALTGAVFTLLRNNAFNDKYEKKVIYINEGYINDDHLKENFINEGYLKEDLINAGNLKGGFINNGNFRDGVINENNLKGGLLNVAYLHNGYINDNYEPLAYAPSEVVINTKLKNNDEVLETHDVKNYHIVKTQPVDIDYKLNSEWLKKISSAQVQNLEGIGEIKEQKEWRKQDDVKENESGIDRPLDKTE